MLSASIGRPYAFSLVRMSAVEFIGRPRNVTMNMTVLGQETDAAM